MGLFSESFYIFIFGAVGIISLLFIWLWKGNKFIGKRRSDKKTKGEKTALLREKDNRNIKAKDSVANVSKKKRLPFSKTAQTSTVHKFEHTHLLSSLKGHTGQLSGADLSSDGKMFISTADDRTMIFWNTKDFSKRDKKFYRYNIPFDHAAHVRCSPDNKAVLIFSENGKKIEVMKLTKNDAGNVEQATKAIEFSEMKGDFEVIALDVAVTGKFILTCTNKNQLTLWDVKGNIMHQLDTKHGDTYSATISPCGRFIVTTGFTPDAKVWEVLFSKTNNFETVKRVFELKGHRSGIFNCSINCDSTKMVTISKDGTWRLFDTNIEYQRGQDPVFLFSGSYTKNEFDPFVAISPDGRTIAVASGPDISLFSGISGQLFYTINDIYPDFIQSVIFDATNTHFITVGDKHPRVFHNVAGFMSTIEDLERSKSSARTSAMKERIITQITEAKKKIQQIDKSCDF